MPKRIRLRFRKEGDLRWIGHLDLARAFERWFRRAGLPLSFTAGCHPRPRIAFPSALPIGETGIDEVLEVTFDGEQSLDVLHATLAHAAPAGLAVTSVEALPESSRASVLSEVAYALPLPPERQTETAARVAELLAQPALPITRGDEPAAELRHLLIDAAVEAGVLRFRLGVPRGRQLRARDVIHALGLDDLREQGCYPARTEVVLQ